MFITPPQQFKVNGKVAFQIFTYERDSSHNSFLRRTRHLLASSGTEQALRGLAQEFRALNPELRADIYKSIVARLFTGYNCSKGEISWHRFEKSPKPGYPYLPRETPLIFKAEEVEKINSFLGVLEEHLGLEHPQGYRFTWVPSKGLMLAGVAREYEYRGGPVRDYLRVEDIPKNLLGEDLAGTVEESSIILLYFHKNSALISTCESLLRSRDRSHQGIACVLKTVISSIPGALRSFRPINSEDDWHIINKDIFDPLAHAILREHEYGHVLSFKKDPRIIPTITMEIRNALTPENINILASLYINSLSEILADLEGPVALIAEVARSDRPLAKQLFWAFLARTFMYAMGIGGSDLFGRINNEFMLEFLVSLLIPNADRPEVNIEKLSSMGGYFCRQIYQQFDRIARLLEQSRALDDRQTEDIKYQALKLVNPREIFGSMALNYDQAAISFFERYSSSPSLEPMS